MTDSAKSSNQPSEKKEQENLIVTPIEIARARHASTHGQSVLDKTRRLSAAKSQPDQPTASQMAHLTAPNGTTWAGLNSCLLVTVLGLAFLVGGILGGLIGGGVILWTSDTTSVALWLSTPTATVQPTPTPVPAETMTPTPTPQPSPTPSVEEIISETIPSVVTVINQQSIFTLNPEEGRVVGSGVIIDDRGYIATNHHVVTNATELHVILSNGQEVTAEFVASDPGEDLAIVKISTEVELPAIRWGDSSQVRPGQIVYAIGSPLGDFPNSVSFGIISGLNRALEMNEHVIDGLIQTDAAINRGSSGGPLINLRGEMIGINTFIIRESEERGIAEGIAFSIPAERAKNLLIPWIMAHGGESVPIPASGESTN